MLHYGLAKLQQLFCDMAMNGLVLDLILLLLLLFYLQPLVGTSVQRAHRVAATMSWKRTVKELSPPCIYHTLIPLL